MTNTLTQASFDYSVVDAESKSKLIWIGVEINKQKATSLEAMDGMGKSIADAQELLAGHGSGTFGKWIETECGISVSSAYNYLHAWGRFKEFPSLGQLTAEAMYLLSAPSAPERATEQAKHLASKGVRVTAKIAKGLLSPSAPPKPAAISKASEVRPEPTVLPLANAGRPQLSPSIDVAAPRPENPDSLESVQADLREYERRLRELARFGRTVLGCEGNEITRPYCGTYSILTLIHPLQHVARTVLNDLPVGGTPDKPVLYHEEKAQKVGA